MPWTKLVADSYLKDDSPKKGGMRQLSYKDAIREALYESLSLDKKVFLMGEGVDDPGGIFGTTLDLHKRFGKNRVFDLPIAENGFTGFAIGAALAGMRPIIVHQRMDFMLVSMDQIVNHAAKWSYMFGAQQAVPLTIRCIIGRGWGSAAQHSQSLEGLFMKIPGLKIVCPSNAYDAKGLLLAAIAENNPVIIVEHRWLFEGKAGVPKKIYFVPIGKAQIKRKGRHVTILAYSLMVRESLDAAQILKRDYKIDAEVIDLKTLAPLDKKTIVDSVRRTGRAVVASLDWKTGGVASEIMATIDEGAFSCLKASVERVSLPDCPTPGSEILEKEFYKGKDDIVKAVLRTMKRKAID
jgi:acetoin:2,6-dichlorophenolindophenol oxidoreductase subunit beta